MTRPDQDALEVVAECSYRGTGLAAAALAGEAAQLYQPLRLGTEPAGPSQHDRPELAAALQQDNQRWRHPLATELSATLADSAARVVVTGQQPGIFGGPLLTLVKALAAGLWAERLRKEGQPAVAVFWIAGEDHDFAEVASTSWLVGNDLRRASLGDDREPLRPVGRRSLGDPITDLLGGWRETLSSDFWQAEAMRLDGCFQPQAGFTESFARYLVAALGDRCPLLLDAENPTVKRLERPWIERLIARRQQVDVARAERNRKILDAGFQLQITPRKSAAPLFLHQDGGRRRILWSDDGFALETGEPTRPVTELTAALADDPGCISPSALTRPPIQDALLGSSMFVVGPGELSYLAQAAPLYDLLGVEAPSIAVRPSVALAARRKVGKVDGIDLPLDDLATGTFDVKKFLARRAGTNPVAGVEAELERTLGELRQQLAAIDSNLDPAWEKTRDGINKALSRLQSRVDSSLARRDQVTADRVEELAALLAPGGTPQERVLSTAWALGRFGPDLPQRLAQTLDLTPGRMQVFAV